jgi:hypothetical protein
MVAFASYPTLTFITPRPITFGFLFSGIRIGVEMTNRALYTERLERYLNFLRFALHGFLSGEALYKCLLFIIHHSAFIHSRIASTARCEARPKNGYRSRTALSLSNR